MPDPETPPKESLLHQRLAGKQPRQDRENQRPARGVYIAPLPEEKKVRDIRQKDRDREQLKQFEKNLDRISRMAETAFVSRTFTALSILAIIAFAIFIAVNIWAALSADFGKLVEAL